MKTESKKKVVNRSVVYRIMFSSMILSLIALFELFVHVPGVFSGDKASIVATISGVSTIIGVIGVIKRLKWGLYLLGFSIIFPVFFFHFFDVGILCKFAELFTLFITIHLMLAYKVCNCDDPDAKARLLRFSKGYFHTMLIIVLSFLLAAIFCILSCAYESSKARGAPGELTWDDIKIQFEQMNRSRTLPF